MRDKYMKARNGVDIVIGSPIVVVRQGLMTSGWEGVVTAIGNAVVEVRFDRPQRRIMKYNPMSIQVVLDAAKKEEKPKQPKKPKAPVMVEEFLLPSRGDWVFYNSNGNLKVVECRGDNILIDDNNFINAAIGVKFTVDDYVGFIERNTKVKYIKPEDKDEYPFWVDGLSFEEDIIRGISNPDNFGTLLIGTDNVFYSVEWVDKKILSRSHMVPRPDFVPMNEKITAHTTKRSAALQDSGLCFGIGFSNNKGELRNMEYTGAACHYAMKTWGQTQGKCEYVVQYVTSKFKVQSKQHGNNVSKYLLWVMNDSPWAQYIFTKDLNEAIASGILINPHIPSNALMCTLYALRYSTEYMEKITDWSDKVDEGFDPAACFYYVETRNLTCDYSSHHQLLDTHSMTLVDVYDFVNCKAGKTVEPIYTTNYRYNNVSIHHGRKGDVDKTGFDELNKMFKAGKVEFNHPVLGKQVKNVSAVDQILQHLTDIAKEAK